MAGPETVFPPRRDMGFARRRKEVFAFRARTSERTAIDFGVPAAQAVERGTAIEL